MLQAIDWSNSIMDFVFGFCSSSFVSCSTSFIEFILCFSCLDFLMEDTESSSFFFKLKRVFSYLITLVILFKRTDFNSQFVIVKFQRKQIHLCLDQKHFDTFKHTKALLFRNILDEKNNYQHCDTTINSITKI